MGVCVCVYECVCLRSGDKLSHSSPHYQEDQSPECSRMCNEKPRWMKRERQREVRREEREGRKTEMDEERET